MNHPPVGVLRALVVVGILAFAVAGYAWTRISDEAGAFHGTPYPDSPEAPDFLLVDHRDEPASLTDYRGRAVLLFFGFTNCPDFCPLTLARLSRVLDEGGIRPEELAVLLVTVDPETDSPAVLADYVGRFGPWTDGLTGTAEELDQVRREYGAFAEERHDHDGPPTIAHTTVVFAIDANGRLRALLHPDEPAELLLDDIRILLRGQS